MTASRSMGLGELADVIGPTRVLGIPVGEVTSLAYDSRRAQLGTLFFAVPGDHVDGHDFVIDAVTHGAVGVVAERETPGVSVPQLIVARTRDALADAADAWYGRPSERLEVIGVTGTDGKTTTTNLIFSILKAAGLSAGMISTVNAVIGERALDTGLHTTTPDADEVQGYLAQMRDAGMTHCVLEVTSHGLAQYRVDGCDFDVAVVTNITHEHLDWHGSWEGYLAAKARLFQFLRATLRKPGIVLNSVSGLGMPPVRRIVHLQAQQDGQTYIATWLEARVITFGMDIYCPCEEDLWDMRDTLLHLQSEFANGFTLRINLLPHGVRRHLDLRYMAGLEMTHDLHVSSYLQSAAFQAIADDPIFRDPVMQSVSYNLGDLLGEGFPWIFPHSFGTDAFTTMSPVCSDRWSTRSSIGTIQRFRSSFGWIIWRPKSSTMRMPLFAFHCSGAM